MNKILISVFAISFFMCTTACNSNNTSQPTDSDSTAVDSTECEEPEEVVEFSVENVQFKDSLSNPDAMTSYYTIDVDVPQGDSQLAKSIRQWITNCLSDDYKGKIDFSEKMLKSISSKFFKRDDDTPTASRQVEIKVVYESDDYVTYEVLGSDYYGGAHDIPYNYGKTFDKQTGRIISDDLFESTEGLAKVIKKHLASYFDENSDVEIDDVLFDNVRDEFPLPANGGWLVEDGVKFIYGVYEIVPYAAGMPECVISYDELKPYLAEGIVK